MCHNKKRVLTDSWMNVISTSWVVVAEIGFEPMTSRLWAWRATSCCHSAMLCCCLHFWKRVQRYELFSTLPNFLVEKMPFSACWLISPSFFFGNDNIMTLMAFRFDSAEYSVCLRRIFWFHAEMVLPSPKVLSPHLVPICERVPISDQSEWIRPIPSPSKPWRESKSLQRLSRSF